MPIQGITINDDCGSIDFNALATSPFQFVFMRGAIAKVQDDMVYRNSKEARRIGMPFGVYYEIKPQSAWKPQVEFHMEVEAEYGGNMPPVLFLNNDGGLSKVEMEGWSFKWIKQMEAKFDRPVTVMTNAPFCNKQLPLTDFLWRKLLFLEDLSLPVDIPLEWANHKKSWTFLYSSSAYPVSQYGITTVVKVPKVVFYGYPGDFEQKFKVKPRPITPVPEAWKFAKPVSNINPRVGPGSEFADGGTLLQGVSFEIAGVEQNGYLPLIVWGAKSLLEKA